jgi:hypothetical protein
MGYHTCVCSFAWCKEARKIAKSNGLDQFEGGLTIPRAKGGKWEGTDGDMIAGFTCARWLYHIKANETDLNSQSCISRVHFSEVALRMASANRGMLRMYKHGSHISDTTTEADVCFKPNKLRRTTLMVLPNMIKEGAMAQVQTKQ